MTEQKTRRVGSWTLGVVLIALGGCMLAYHFFPGFNYLVAAKLAPLVLVALGVEVLICAARPDVRKYDFLSIFVCLLVMGAALCVSLIPLVWDYISPMRAEKEYAMARQMEATLYEQLKDSDVSEASVYLSLSGSQSSSASVENLSGSEWISVNVGLTGPYAEQDAFTARAVEVARAAAALPVQVDELSIYWNHTGTVSAGQPANAALHLQGPYQLDWSAEAIAAHTEWILCE